jgi:hypothetical protein
MSTDSKAAREAITDKIKSQARIVRAKLETLKAKAESAKAGAELTTIMDLLAAKKAIDRQLDTLQKSTEKIYEQTRADIELRLAELEKSAQAVEAELAAIHNP